MQDPEHYSRRRRCADDPTKVIARADKPIVAGCNCSESVAGQGKDCLTCGTPYDIAGQTPQVTFADGLAPMGNDEFVVRAAPFVSSLSLSLPSSQSPVLSQSLVFESISFGSVSPD